MDLVKNRIETFDIAKGIGILIMVLGHTGFGDSFDKIIHTFHMPLFFFISGYFYRPEKTKSFKEYLVHQIDVLLIPYLVFAIFYEILHYIYVGEVSIDYFFKSLISSNHNRIDVAGALWFLLSLFTAKIIYHVLEKNIKSIFDLSIVITVISLCAMTLRRFGVLLPFGLDSAMSMLIIIHMGYLLYRFREKKLLHKLSTLSPYIIFVLIVLFFVTGFVNDHVNVRRNKYGVEVLYMISCLSGILLTMNISHLLGHTGNKVLRYIKSVFSFWGRESIVFLLVNELFLFIVSEAFVVVGVSRSMISGNYWVRSLFVLGAMALMSLLALCSNKRPLSYIFGKHQFFKQRNKKQ